MPNDEALQGLVRDFKDWLREGDVGPNIMSRQLDLIVERTHAAGYKAGAEAMARDAERYRAIRNDAINPMCMFAAKADDELMVGVESMLTGVALDAAIDAARALERTGE